MAFGLMWLGGCFAVVWQVDLVSISRGGVSICDSVGGACVGPFGVLLLFGKWGRSIRFGSALIRVVFHCCVVVLDVQGRL